jgi:hypothetical protein
MDPCGDHDVAQITSQSQQLKHVSGDVTVAAVSGGAIFKAFDA